VTSFAVRSRGARVLLDPLAPPPSAREAWERLEAFAADTVVILKPDHVRDVDLFVRWYGARALGPFLFWRDDIPKPQLEGVRTGDELPGGLVALDDGRGMMETPLYLPEQRVLPALRELLELPFEHVIVSHGEPVHERPAFEEALEREPWSDWAGA